MITAIVASYNCFYCNNCKSNHRILYIDGKKHYCNKCLPSSIDKTKVKYINQNREILEGFKEE